MRHVEELLVVQQVILDTTATEVRLILVHRVPSDVVAYHVDVSGHRHALQAGQPFVRLGQSLLLLVLDLVVVAQVGAVIHPARLPALERHVGVFKGVIEATEHMGSRRLALVLDIDAAECPFWP